MLRRAFTGVEVVVVGVILAGLAAGMALIGQQQNFVNRAACSPVGKQCVGGWAHWCYENGSLERGDHCCSDTGDGWNTCPGTVSSSCKPSGNSASACDGKNPGTNVGPCTCQLSNLGGNDCWCQSNTTCQGAGGSCYSGSTCSGQNPPRNVVNGGGGCSANQVCCGGTVAVVSTPTPTQVPGIQGCGNLAGRCVINTATCTGTSFGQLDCGAGNKCVTETAACTTPTPTKAPTPTSFACASGSCYSSGAVSCAEIGLAIGSKGGGNCQGICCGAALPTATPRATATPAPVATPTTVKTPSNTLVPTVTKAPIPTSTPFVQSCDNKAGKCVKTSLVCNPSISSNNYGRLDCKSDELCVRETAVCGTPTPASAGTNPGNGTQAPGTGSGGSQGNTGTGSGGSQGTTGTGNTGNQGSTGTGSGGSQGNTGTGSGGSQGTTGTGSGLTGGTNETNKAATAVVVELRGDVKLNGQSAGVGVNMNNGDTLTTGTDSSARVDLADGTIVRISANTQYTLVAQAQVGGSFINQLQLVLGQMWLAFVGGETEIQTPTGVAVVRGTVFGVSYSNESGTNVVVQEGVVVYKDLDKTAEIPVTANQMLEVRRNSDLPSLKAQTVRNEIAWVKDNQEADAKIANVIMARKEEKENEQMEEDVFKTEPTKKEINVIWLVIRRLVLNMLWLFGN